MQQIEVRFAPDEVTPKGEFAGYGAVFGNVDSYGDVIAPGAFQETLKGWEARGKLPPMLLQHGGMGMSDGDGLPVGKWIRMREDDRGLQVEGRLINLDTERGKSIYGALREGVLDGLSIGFRTKEFALRTKPEEPRRTLKAVDLVEVSIVTFPANREARVAAVKSAASITTIREFEGFLRDVGGFSKEEAKALAAGGFRAMAERRDAGSGEAFDTGLDRFLATLRQEINP
jgi:hypothetical protein